MPLARFPQCWVGLSEFLFASAWLEPGDAGGRSAGQDERG
jgi:hypothetical protein